MSQLFFKSVQLLQHKWTLLYVFLVEKIARFKSVNSRFPTNKESVKKPIAFRTTKKKTNVRFLIKRAATKIHPIGSFKENCSETRPLMDLIHFETKCPAICHSPIAPFITTYPLSRFPSPSLNVLICEHSRSFVTLK